MSALSTLQHLESHMIHRFVQSISSCIVHPVCLLVCIDLVMQSWKSLKDECTIAENGIYNGMTLTASLRLRGGMEGGDEDKGEREFCACICGW